MRILAFLVCFVSALDAETPFACNLRAFQPGERKQWRKLIEEMSSAVVEARELPDGYTLHVDSRRTSLVKLSEWAVLERKCCPFFDFELVLHGEDGSLWLNLRGRDGVKQFIREDFTLLRDRLGTARVN